MEGRRTRIRRCSALVSGFFLAFIVFRLAFETCSLQGCNRSQTAGGSGLHGASKSRRYSSGSSTERQGTIPIFFYITNVRASYLRFLDLTATFNPDTPLYVITSTETPPEPEIQESLNKLGVTIRYIERYVHRGSAIEIFRKHYIHRAINPLSYERMCFERFFIFKEVALREGIQRMVISDADIALFEDVRKTPFARFDHGFVSITQWSTNFGLWRVETLHQFCNYILWFYQRPRVRVDADIGKYGDYVPVPQNGTAARAHMRHFSDMFILSAFLKSRNVSQASLEHDKDSMRHLVALENPQRLRPPGDDSVVCESGEHFDSYVDWRMTPRGVLAPYHNGALLVGIHFQGPLCKEKVVPYIVKKLFPDVQVAATW